MDDMAKSLEDIFTKGEEKNVLTQDFEHLSLRDIFLRSTEKYASRPAFSFVGKEAISYQQFGEAVLGLSQWLQEQGIGFGDKVAILSENNPHWGIAYFAIVSMGAVAVPILTEFHSGAIAHIIRHSEAKAVFVSDRLFSKLDNFEFSPHLFFIHMESFTAVQQNYEKDSLQDLKKVGLREFRKWIEKTLGRGSKPPVLPTGNSLAAIIYTSGTTGHAKGVMLRHKNIIANIFAISSLISLSEKDIFLSVLPLAHTFESSLGLVTPLAYGMHVVYLDKPPTGRVLLPALAKVRPTVMLCVPLIMEKVYKNNVLPELTKTKVLRFFYQIPMFRRLLHRLAGKRLRALFGGRLRIMAIGGAPIPVGTEQFLREAKFPFTIGYGLTECSPLLSASRVEDSRQGSAGQAVLNVNLRIVDINPQTGEGSIEAWGPNVMQGYYKDEDATGLVLSQDGWLKTGDLGYFDADQFIYIKGRSKNMLLGSSGENIYPEEIESLLTSTYYVEEALVLQLEGRLVAKVLLDNTKIDQRFGDLNTRELNEKKAELLVEIRDEINGQVSSFARLSKIYEQAEPFEKTPTHKIKRYLYIEAS